MIPCLCRSGPHQIHANTYNLVRLGILIKIGQRFAGIPTVNVSPSSLPEAADEVAKTQNSETKTQKREANHRFEIPVSFIADTSPAIGSDKNTPYYSNQSIEKQLLYQQLYLNYNKTSMEMKDRKPLLAAKRTFHKTQQF